MASRVRAPGDPAAMATVAQGAYMRATGRLALAVGLVALLPVSAAAKEEVVYLPGTGLQVKVECKVSTVDRSDMRRDRAGREFGTDTMELMLDQKSYQYQLSLMPTEKGDISLCDDPVAQVERLQGTWVDKPAWLPKAFRPRVIENREDGRYRIGACADVPGGALFAAVRISEPGPGSPTAESQKRVATVLERLLAAAGPSQVALKNLGVSAELPLLAGAWSVDKKGDAVRLSDRRAIRFEKRKGSCDTLITGATRSRPAFLPELYYEQVLTRGLDGLSGHYVVCLDGAQAVLADVDGLLSGGNPDDKRVAMVLQAIGGKVLPTPPGPPRLELPTSGLSVIAPEIPARRWVRTGEGEAPGGKADALSLPANQSLTALVRFAPGPCVAPGNNFREAPDHLEWWQWRVEGAGSVQQHWCTGLYRGHVTVTLHRPPGHEGDDAMYELMRGVLAAAQRKAGLVPNTGLASSVLPAVGLVADLPLGWTARDGGNGQDFVENGVRGDGSRLVLDRATGNCEAHLAGLAAKGGADAGDKYPAPSGWHGKRVVESDGRTVNACHDLEAGQVFLARLVPGKADAEATWTTVTPVLEALAKRAGALVASDE